MAVISIPKSYMGRTMQESTFKAKLRELNPEIHFDLGACLNIWHPFKDTRQNVYYRGNSLCAMDRGTLPEVPVWSTRKDMVRVPIADVRPGEIVLYETIGVIAGCQKCTHVWPMPNRPVGAMACPSGCGNAGLSSDEKLWIWKDRRSEFVQVFRQMKDRVILVGWRWTLGKLARKGVPGITRQSLEDAFKISLDAVILEEVMVDDDVEDRVLDRGVSVGA
jgi:hypothetical protein